MQEGLHSFFSVTKRKEATPASPAPPGKAEEPVEEGDENAQPSITKKTKKPVRLLKHVVAVVSADAARQADLVTRLEALGAKVGRAHFFFWRAKKNGQVLKRPSKTITHLVFGVGGDANMVVSALDEGAFLVGPTWVDACEAGRCEAGAAGHDSCQGSIASSVV